MALFISRCDTCSYQFLMPTKTWFGKDAITYQSILDDALVMLLLHDFFLHFNVIILILYCFLKILYFVLFYFQVVHSSLYYSFTCFNCFLMTMLNLQMVQSRHFILERSSSVLGILITWNGYSCELGQINQLQTSLILTERSDTNSHSLISLISNSTWLQKFT
jgi:hypothetical protein